MVSAPDYDFYVTRYFGTLDAESFVDSLPAAGARLRLVTGRDASSVQEWQGDAYRNAWCALVDRVAGADTRGTLKSETVGSTTVAYSDASVGGRPFGDYDAVLPWLSGTGLLCQAIGGRYGL